MASIYTLIRISEMFDLDINYLIGKEISIVNKNRFIGKSSYEEYEIIKELRKNNKLHELFVKYPKRTIKRINKIFF